MLWKVSVDVRTSWYKGVAQGYYYEKLNCLLGIQRILNSANPGTNYAETIHVMRMTTP